ncbi:MAG: ribose 5-phosphate isomerase B [Thermotogaceae bacterium]|nr:ribose 5-phosphate isomerase B [Thermotogaceae bacterium]RKX38424.1 MAG: ribose 5-phosphate isomerase B [Thermotogota bacterium]RKX50376.1 MAG: ribose 5-phosphate isomerase B [Thermotoga sp.]RKX56852.1 MAG: ribose 5-phosphate isomerase B [Thermotoga sp.]HDG62293.1 ribose 5-phosphate isomerase B [Thermotoga sp.]
MKIAIASDHAGFRLKEGLKAFFERNNIDYIDFGTDSTASVDYPDFAKKVVDCIRNGCADFGVLICGTGLGMSMAANRFKGIRAALCFFPEMARLARKDNNANILVLPGRFMGIELAEWVLSAFLETKFEGGRHERRIRKLEDYGS